jgi:hypothetical protein
LVFIVYSAHSPSFSQKSYISEKELLYKNLEHHPQFPLSTPFALSALLERAVLLSEAEGCIPIQSSERSPLHKNSIY